MIPSYPKTGHWPKSLTVHRDDHYHNDPNRFVDVPVVITEKLDGGITQIANQNVYARSSGAPTRDGWFTYVKSVTLPKLHSVAPNLLLIGEDLYAVHSIQYDPLPDTFFLFHVLNRMEQNIETEKTEGDHFWSWNNVMVLARMYGLLHAPVLFSGTFKSVDDITDWFFEQNSKPSLYGPVREGFVMRIADGFPFETFRNNVCKFVRANHVETTEHWTKNWQPAKIQK